jgi:hypothetical protein
MGRCACRRHADADVMTCFTMKQDVFLALRYFAPSTQSRVFLPNSLVETQNRATTFPGLSQHFEGECTTQFRRCLFESRRSLSSS